MPASAPSSEPLPDVFATKGNCILAFEVKTTHVDRAYFKKSQVKKLFDFLSLFDAYPERMAVLVCKSPYRWVFKHVKHPDDYSIGIDEKSDTLSG